MAQTGNPVENPPFNNWSVNQPSVPHISGLNGFADLGQNIIVDGHRVHYAQLDAQLNMEWKNNHEKFSSNENLYI